MKLELDDNERGAFHYLFAGVFFVLLMKGFVMALDSAKGMALHGPAALEQFQRGYFLGQGGWVVATANGRLERVVFGIVCAVAFSLLSALLVGAMAKLLRADGKRVGLGWARWALVLTVGWGSYSALFLPLQQARTADGGLLVIQRRALIGDIPVPFSGTERTWPSDSISLVEVVTMPAGTRCEGLLRIEAVTTAGDRIMLTREEGICAAQEMELLRSGSEAAALLDRDRR